MPLSPADRAKVMVFLDNLNAQEAQRVVASESAFRNWFAVTLPDIFWKIRDRVAQLWGWLKAVFA